MKIIMMIVLSLQTAIASESVGFYSRGSQNKAPSILDRKTPVQKLFVPRGRLYTSEQMLGVLEDATLFVKNNFPNSEILQIGDLSAKNGGEVSGHASHQNGLDADIVYLRRNGFVQDENALNWQESFIKNNTVTENFHLERNFELFVHLVRTNLINRIFVDPLIKRDICQYAITHQYTNNPIVTETLRRLRPLEEAHDTHLHLRLICPNTDIRCIKQVEPPEGDSCSDALIFLEKITPADEAC